MSSGMVLALVCVGQFMVVLDLSIVNVALPSMQRDLGFTTSGLQWVVNAYALAFGGFLLLGGRAADLFGRRRVFMLGLMLFGGASLVCAVAQNQFMLVGARALQGLGAAVLSPATLTILTMTFRAPAERSRAARDLECHGRGGGRLGGAARRHPHRPVVVAVDLLRQHPHRGGHPGRGARRAERDPRRGPAPLARRPRGGPGHGGALLARVRGGRDEHARVELDRDDRAPGDRGRVPGDVRRHRDQGGARPARAVRACSAPRALTASNVAMLFAGGAMFSMWFFVSLYLQDVLHFSPLVTGLGFLPQTAAIAIAAQISSRLVPRYGPRPPLLVGVAMSACRLGVAVAGRAHRVLLGIGLRRRHPRHLRHGPRHHPPRLRRHRRRGPHPGGAGIGRAQHQPSDRGVGGPGRPRHHRRGPDPGGPGRRPAPGRPSAVHQAVALTAGFSRGLAVAALIALVGFVAGLFIPRQARLAPRSVEPGPRRGRRVSPSRPIAER